MKITDELIQAGLFGLTGRHKASEEFVNDAYRVIAAVAPLILEEAAKIADAEAAEQDELDLEGTMRAETAGHIADRIRALKEQDNGKA